MSRQAKDRPLRDHPSVREDARRGCRAARQDLRERRIRLLSTNITWTLAGSGPTKRVQRYG